MPSPNRDLPSSEHIVASVSDPSAGPSHSVRGLTAALARSGARVGLRTVAGWRGDALTGSDCATVNHTAYRHDFAGVPMLADVCLSRELDQSLRTLAQDTDILHGHGLWLMPNVYPSWATRSGRARLIVSPRGMLGAEALAFSSLKKQVFWRLFQERALRTAACLHATSEDEHAAIRASGLTNPVAVIPNGVSVPEPVPSVTPNGRRTALSLGRIHPKKVPRPTRPCLGFGRGRVIRLASADRCRSG